MKVLLGVTGSISAYKSVEILRFFQKSGHQVTVVMTDSAKKFVTPLVFDTFIPGRVFSDMFSSPGKPIIHIDLAEENDLFLIAPATANMIGKFANGIADDLLSTLYLAFDGRIVLSPAMNSKMLKNDAVQNNLDILGKRGVEIILPESGSLACSTNGEGRLPEPGEIFKYCVEK